MMKNISVAKQLVRLVKSIVDVVVVFHFQSIFKICNEYYITATI
jgi:hypothetical protein